MKYLQAKLNLHIHEKAYRVYVTDSLKIYLGLSDRYIDLIKPKKQDRRSGDEIAADVIAKLGLKGAHDESI